MAGRHARRYGWLDRPASRSAVGCAGPGCPRLPARTHAPRACWEVARERRAHRPRRPRCPSDCREAGGKGLPPSGFGKYFLYKRRERFSRFKAGALPTWQGKIKPNQVNARREWPTGVEAAVSAATAPVSRTPDQVFAAAGTRRGANPGTRLPEAWREQATKGWRVQAGGLPTARK